MNEGRRWQPLYLPNWGGEYRPLAAATDDLRLAHNIAAGAITVGAHLSDPDAPCVEAAVWDRDNPGDLYRLRESGAWDGPPPPGWESPNAE